MWSKIRDIVISGCYGSLNAKVPSPDPLTEGTALHEATLLSTLYIPLSSTFAVLLDIRTSMYLSGHMNNTALLIIRNVSSAQIQAVGGKDSRVWLIDELVITSAERGVSIALEELLWRRSINIKGTSVEFMAGYVPDIGHLADSIEENNSEGYSRTTPNWESMISLTECSNKAHDN